jgi:protein-S-isoprenylcysteine O-methyltransferase Ste14
MKRLILYAVPLLAFEVVLAAILFGSAGRLDLPWFWALLGVHAPLLAVGASIPDRSLMRERLRPGPGSRDRGYRAALTVIILSQLVVAGLDAGRFRWSPVLPDAVRAVALACYALGFALSLWAIAANRFFSSVVRVQSDRGHTVVRDGPYRLVRHPGYLGMSIAVVSESFVLGSYWSLLPLVAFALVLVSRTAIEDRMLRSELAGYEDYARAVTYRLAPGIW